MKTYNPTISKENILRMMLFNTQQNGNFKKNLILWRFFWLLLFGFVGAFLYTSEHLMAFYTSIACGLAIIVFYKPLLRWQFSKSFSAYIDKRLTKMVGMNYTITLGDENFTVKEGENESTMNYDEVCGIYEITDELLIHLATSGNMLIVPRSTPGFSDLKSELISRTQASEKVGLIDMPDWAW